MIETTVRNAAAKAFSALENLPIISRSFNYLSKSDQAQRDNDKLTVDEISNKFWLNSLKRRLENINYIYFPSEIQFDLSVTIARATLLKLASQEDHFEREYDENGNITSSSFIAEIDEEAQKFYVKTMSKNLRAYFTEAPIQNYTVQSMSAAAAKGLVEAQSKSGMTDDEIDVALTRAKDGFSERDRRRFIEIIALNSNLIGKNTKNKCTHYAQNSLSDRIAATKIWMENHVVSNGKIKLKLSVIGQTIKKRVSEMFCAATGVQAIAEEYEMRWASVVVTLEAVKHPNPKNGRSCWDGTTPKQSNKLFSKRFARVRAMLAKKGITLVGLWTREAHGDATPHVNYLIYFKIGEEAVVEAAFNKHFSHSNNAIEFKIGEKATYIDENGVEKKAASFSSYAMKYFMKFLSEEPDEKTLEESAWASTWGIRRFGFFGLPSIQIWRRMRKSEHSIKHSVELEELRLACRSNNFAEFIRLCGGLGIKRSKRDFQTIRENDIVIGVKHVKSDTEFINKRLGEWSITKETSKRQTAKLDQIVNTKTNITGTSEATFNKKVTVVLNYPRKAKNDYEDWYDYDQDPIFTEGIDEKESEKTEVRIKHPHHSAIIDLKKRASPLNYANIDGKFTKMWQEMVMKYANKHYAGIDTYIENWRDEWEMAY